MKPRPVPYEMPGEEAIVLVPNGSFGVDEMYSNLEIRTRLEGDRHRGERVRSSTSSWALFQRAGFADLVVIAADAMNRPVVVKGFNRTESVLEDMRNVVALVLVSGAVGCVLGVRTDNISDEERLAYRQLFRHFSRLTLKMLDLIEFTEDQWGGSDYRSLLDRGEVPR